MRTLLLYCFSFFCLFGYSQTSAEALKPNAERERMFLPYLAVHHGGPDGTAEWKEQNILRYYQELWYYCESFYVHRDYLEEGAPLLESTIDISRFENQRKLSETSVVILPGMKDALILLPKNQLIHKPDYLPE
jgi:hypothetical protein